MPGRNRRVADRREVEASYTAQPQSAPWRFNELLRDLDGISQKVLSIGGGTALYMLLVQTVFK